VLSRLSSAHFQKIVVRSGETTRAEAVSATALTSFIFLSFVLLDVFLENYHHQQQNLLRFSCEGQTKKKR
jgi:hypothetical protein